MWRIRRNIVVLTWLLGLSGQVEASKAGKKEQQPQRLQSKQSSKGGKQQKAAPKALVKKPPPSVELYSAQRGERMYLVPYDNKGKPKRGVRKELSHFLRCPHTGEEHQVDARLVPVLYKMGRHFGHRVVIYSGYRPPRFTTVKRSRHLWAAAIDFRIPGVKNRDVVKWLRSNDQGVPLGVGYYPDGTHIHVDVDRTYDTFWVKRGSDALPLVRHVRPRS